jgi:hypothetical protein
MGGDMSKVVIDIGYKSYVLDAQDAVMMANLFGRAEVYKAEWHSKTDTMDSHHTYHIYTEEGVDAPTMRILSDDAYKMYKLAGKPARD